MTPPARPSHLDWVLLTIGVLPLVLAFVRLAPLVSSGWTPIRDSALLELRTADVGTTPVLLGPYSRFGWHHPGPSLFYLLAVPYRILGRSSVALPLTAVAVNLVSVIGMAAVAWRRGGRTLLLALLLVLQAYLATLGPWALRSPWNPTVVILPLGLVLLLAWGTSCGDHWCLPVAAGVVSLVIQSHVGFAAVALVVIVASTVWAVTRGRGVPVVPIALAVAILVLLWAPPAAEQLVHDPGNLEQLESSLRAAEGSLTPLEGAKVALARLGAIPAWLSGTGASPGPDEAGAALWPGAVTLAALVVAGGLAWRQRRLDRMLLAVTAALTFVGCALTAGRIEGEVEDWLVAWMSLPGVLVWALCAWMVLERVGRTPRRAAAVMLVTGAVVTAMAVSSGIAAVDATLWRTGASDTVASLERQLGPRLRSDERPARMTFGPRASDVSPMGWGAGLVLALEKKGIDVRVDPRWRLQFGEHRTDVRGTGRRLMVATDERYVPARGQHLVAEAGGVFVYSSE